MHLMFVDRVESVSRDDGSFGVTFCGRRGRYDVPAEPDDLRATLNQAHRAHAQVRVTYDAQTFVIVDVISGGSV